MSRIVVPAWYIEAVTTGLSAAATQQAINKVFRAEAPRLIAGLTRIVRDVGTAEELSQDALVAALEQWPTTGIPDNPGAWLMSTGKNRAINVLRRGKMLARRHEQLGHEIETAHSLNAVDVEAAIDNAPVADDLLRLVFISCHPVLPLESRVALTLRLLGGLTTEEIARAFLATEPTIAQRIVRAKKTLRDANVPFELPPREELAERAAAVLGVIYLVYNEGYSATAGDDLMRPQLCEDAIRLGTMLAELMPGAPEVHGLLALMLLQSSRTPARTDAEGEPVLLLEQDRSRWDREKITRGLAALERAGRGPYGLQAAIAACHARATRPEDTDWTRIAAIYGELLALNPSPVIELNRAVAVSMAEGPAAGLALLDALKNDPTLARYHLLPSARADFLAKLGRHAEAKAEFERAASLTRNERERELLRRRARECDS